MLAAKSGAVGFLARHHTAALSAVAAFTGIATAAAMAMIRFQPFVWTDVATLALGAMLAAAISFWHVRHPILAILVAATPLPGLLWAAPLADGSNFGLIPVVAYGFGFALATLYVQHVLDRLLRQSAGETPWRSAGAVLVLAVVLAQIWFHHSESGEAAVQAVCDLAATFASVLLILPLSTALLRFDEVFVASANRARECRGRIYEWLGGAAVPRWGMSLTGIALVFVAIGWFGGEAMLQPGWWRYGVTVVMTCLLLGAFAGGWREGCGLGLVLSLVAITALWWRGYDTRATFGAVAVFETTVLAGLLAVSEVRRMRRWRSSGEPSETVYRRAMEEAEGCVFATLGAVAAAVPSLFHAGAAVIALSITAAGFGALALPGFLTAIETLLPRRRTVEDVFNARRRT